VSAAGTTSTGGLAEATGGTATGGSTNNTTGGISTGGVGMGGSAGGNGTVKQQRVVVWHKQRQVGFVIQYVGVHGCLLTRCDIGWVADNRTQVRKG
jgi:hypothetical protein